MNVAIKYEIGYESLQFLAFIIIRKQISYTSNNEERFLFNDFYLMLKIQSNIANVM